MTHSPLTILELRDIVEPSAVGLWPMSPGAWLLLGLWLLAMGFVGWRLGRRSRANAYRRAALRELETVRRVFESVEKSVAAPGGGTRPPSEAPPDAARLVCRISEILKRTALAAFPRSEVAGLSGAEWVRWLNASGCGAEFVGTAARLLQDAVYGKIPPDGREVGELLIQATNWIRRHRLAPVVAVESLPSTAG